MHLHEHISGLDIFGQFFRQIVSHSFYKTHPGFYAIIYIHRSQLTQFVIIVIVCSIMIINLLFRVRLDIKGDENEEQLCRKQL